MLYCISCLEAFHPEAASGCVCPTNQVGEMSVRHLSLISVLGRTVIPQTCPCAKSRSLCTWWVTLQGDIKGAKGIKLVNELIQKKADYPGLPRGPNIISGPLVWKREAEEPVLEWCRGRRTRPAIASLMMEEGTTSQGLPVASISWKGQGGFLESPEENAILLTPCD